MGLPLPTILVTVPPDPHTAACMGMPQSCRSAHTLNFWHPTEKKIVNMPMQSR